jgi:hypothetical protein
VRELVEVVEKSHTELSMRRQCKLLGVARSSVEYEAVPECSEDLKAKGAVGQDLSGRPVPGKPAAGYGACS